MDEMTGGLTDDRLLRQGMALLQREGQLLDDGQWQQWLELYTEDCTYWLPTRRADETLTDDPETELSHIYYASRAGLEDRVLRIQSGRSAASTPIPRTTHLMGCVTPLVPPTPQQMQLHASWVTHVFLVRSRSSHAFFGSADVTLVQRGGGWRIASKRIVLQNDYIPTLIDIYCF